MRAPRDPQWATPRPDVLEDVQHQAEAARDDAAAPAERLSGTGEKAPAQGPDSQWAKQWDTPAGGALGATRSSERATGRRPGTAPDGPRPGPPARSGHLGRPEGQSSPAHPRPTAATADAGAPLARFT